MSNKPAGKRKFVPSISSTETNHSKDCNETISHKTIEEESKTRLNDASTLGSVLDRTMTSSGQSEWSRSINSSFRNVLYQYVGEQVRENDVDIIFSNDMATLLLDAYPKAAVHLLLLPKESFLSVRQVRDFQPNQIEKIRQFHSLAREVAASIEQGDQSFDLIPSKWHVKLRTMYRWRQPLKCGYHVIPSLYPLHLHIISSDFISPTLKNKGHWNKFTTEYFIEISEVETKLSTLQNERCTLNEALPNDEFYDLVLKKPLTCHHCGEIFSNIPKLKWHIEDCMMSS